jgi:hypothetical protein
MPDGGSLRACLHTRGGVIRQPTTRDAVEVEGAERSRQLRNVVRYRSCMVCSETCSLVYSDKRDSAARKTRGNRGFHYAISTNMGLA